MDFYCERTNGQIFEPVNAISNIFYNSFVIINKNTQKKSK